MVGPVTGALAHGDEGVGRMSEPEAILSAALAVGREDIDAVMIALPDHWHGVVACAAAKASKYLSPCFR